MNRKLSREAEQILIENDIIFEVAKLEQLDEIYALYDDRTNWFKDNNIIQWTSHIISKYIKSKRDSCKSKKWFCTIYKV